MRKVQDDETRSKLIGISAGAERAIGGAFRNFNDGKRAWRRMACPSCGCWTDHEIVTLDWNVGVCGFCGNMRQTFYKERTERVKKIVAEYNELYGPGSVYWEEFEKKLRKRYAPKSEKT